MLKADILTMNVETVKWRFLDTGKGSAFFNMALDDAIVDAVGRGFSPPVFRVYEWSPGAITIGYSQKIGDIIDINRCKIDGVDITRRLTGGRAVFHKDELAYSVIGTADDPHFGGNIMDTYRSINTVLADGLNSLGIEAKIIRARMEKGIPNTNRRLFPCFLITSRFEITLDGKKLVGSAQRRLRGLFLQQGSIIIGPGHERITEYMKDRELASEYQKRLSEGSIDLKSKLDGRFSISRLKTALFNSFKKTVGMNFYFEDPGPEELLHTKRLIEEQYSSKGWIFGDE